jgi:hypothetical protein
MYNVPNMKISTKISSTKSTQMNLILIDKKVFKSLGDLNEDGLIVKKYNDMSFKPVSIKLTHRMLKL